MEVNGTNSSIKARAFSQAVVYPETSQIIVMWALPILILSLNTMVFIVSPRMKCRNSYTMYGMISLALADFSIGLIHLLRLSYNTHVGYNIQPTHPICIIDAYCQAILVAISIGTLTFLNFDRYLTMALPFKYPKFLSKCRVLTIHGTIWGFGLIQLIPTTTGLTGTKVKYYKNAFICVPSWAGSLVYNSIVIAIIVGIPGIFNTIAFVGIFILARRKKKLGNRAGDKQARDFKKDLRIFRTLAYMTFGLLLASTPYFIAVALPEMITGHSLHPITDFVTPWLGICNSFWNPLVYVLTLRPFYAALSQMCTGKSVASQSQSNCKSSSPRSNGCNGSSSGAVDVGSSGASNLDSSGSATQVPTSELPKPQKSSSRESKCLHESNSVVEEEEEISGPSDLGSYANSGQMCMEKPTVACTGKSSSTKLRGCNRGSLGGTPDLEGGGVSPRGRSDKRHSIRISHASVCEEHPLETMDSST